MQSISALIALLVCSLFALAQVNTPPRNWHTATLPDLKAAAESGAPDAQFEYGSRFETGRGVTKDQEEANSWYRKASQQGNVSAQFALASRLIEGTAAEQKEACNLFEKAAQTGNAQAAREAGLCYKLGQGSIQDAAKAFTYFTQAATGGDTEGAYQLGMCYRKGEGVAANPAQATRYLNQAANAGHADALTQLAEMTRSGEGAAKNPREALNLYLRAANKGSVTAQWELARMYRDGDGVPPDPAKALLWTKKLASAKQPEAQATLAQLNIDLFKQSARPLTIRGGEITDSQIGALVKLDGEVRSTAEGKWKISIKVLGGQNHVVQVIPPAYVPGAKKTDQPARRPDSSRQNTRDDNTNNNTRIKKVTNDANPSQKTSASAGMDPSKVKEGMQVTVWGTLVDQRTIKGIVCQLAPPSFEWKYQVEDTAGVKAGTTHNFKVKLAFKNTGKTPLRNVKIHMRTYQTSSPIDYADDLIVEMIDVGETLDYSIPMRIYNFQQIGGTSKPKVEIEITGYEY